MLGILVPKSATEAPGAHEHLSHLVSVSAGTAMTAGFAILLDRHLRGGRVAATTTSTDRAVYFLLLTEIATGMLATVGANLIGGGYDYRETVAPWFRGLFQLAPHGSLMAGAPLVYQLHALATLGLFALWPFSRLVHAWSVPLAYLARRAPILYRPRAAQSPDSLPVPNEHARGGLR